MLVWLGWHLHLQQAQQTSAEKVGPGWDILRPVHLANCAISQLLKEPVGVYSRVAT